MPPKAHHWRQSAPNTIPNPVHHDAPPFSADGGTIAIPRAAPQSRAVKQPAMMADSVFNCPQRGSRPAES